jgi:hypothetical protein
MTTRVRGEIAFTNDQPSEVTLVLEPWADERKIAAGESMSITFDGPAEPRLEIVAEPGRIVLGGWEGSVFEFSR